MEDFFTLRVLRVPESPVVLSHCSPADPVGFTNSDSSASAAGLQMFAQGVVIVAEAGTGVQKLWPRVMIVFVPLGSRVAERSRADDAGLAAKKCQGWHNKRPLGRRNREPL